jgi:hypothetical protein
MAELVAVRRGVETASLSMKRLTVQPADDRPGPSREKAV